MRQVYLICNAHIDPAWQWEWDEGLAEALSTFQIAADFCEEFDGFVFNHNEALLYRWVEEYRPQLFAKIQQLVKAGKWHIMGGWYLQPDCVMASGESIARQITVGRQYFKEKFGAVPTVGLNFDSFGHDKGLAQLLKKSGFDSYLVTRPVPAHCGLPEDAEFLWKGYDGSEVKCRMFSSGYGTNPGEAADRIRSYLERYPDKNPQMILWGIGDHGGGPSRIDLQKIAELQQELDGTCQLIHSTPEAYFATMDAKALPVVEHSLSPSMVGCYTSQVRIKQAHRKLENLLFQTEKLTSAAELQLQRPMNWAVLRSAEEILIRHEFHDVLPGSSVEPVEESAINAMGGAIEALRQQRTSAFVALAEAFPAPTPGTQPILLYNPHPWPISTQVECEFQLPAQNWSGTFTDYDVYHNGKAVASQLIKENSTIPLDWRKRLAIEVELAPFAMTRLECHPRALADRPVLQQPEGDTILLENEHLSVEIDRTTGLLAHYRVDGVDLLRPQAGRLVVVPDDEDPWGMRHCQFPDPDGAFRLATPEEAGSIAAQAGPMAPVHLLEQGPVMTRVEAIFTWGHSYAVVRYTFRRHSTQLGIDVELMLQAPSRMVRMELPAAFSDARCLGEGMFGYEELFSDGRENVSQKWTAVANDQVLFALLNQGTHGSCFRDGVLMQTLVRTPAYCAHPIYDRQILPDNRYFSRIDAGKRSFSFLLDGGCSTKLLNRLEQEAQLAAEPPVSLPIYTRGSGEVAPTFLTVSLPTVLVSALKKSADDRSYVLRLYHGCDSTETASIDLPALQIHEELTFGPFEVKTLRLTSGHMAETGMDEMDHNT